MSVSDNLERLGMVLPPVPTPVGSFAPAVRSGNLLFLSGLAPSDEIGKPIVGTVGRDFSAEEAQGFARLVGLKLLAVTAAELGSLDRVTRVVKLLGMVNATADFTRHPFVIDGCSDLFGSVFPHLGCHARSAVGVASLPFGIPVEIEAVIEFGP